MPVAAEAEEHEVEHGQLALGALERGERTQVPLVGRRRGARPLFPVHAVHVDLRQRHVLEERVPCHAVVAGGIIRRHAALVAPVELDAAPGDLLAELLARQQAVESARGLAAAERDGEAAARRRRLLRRQGEQVGGAQGERLGVGKDLDAHG